MQLYELRDYIGTLLEVTRFKDYCPNGIQVEGRQEVLRVATAVTASLEVVEAAVNWGADALIVHHGYFWRGEAPEITGIKKKRIASLLANEMSLLAYHLPLDAHESLGNNAQLARKMGWHEQGRFGEQQLACLGYLPDVMALREVVEKLASELRHTPLVVGDLNQPVRRIAWCSGAAQSSFEHATQLGVDVFVTGEISEQNVHVARESGVAFIAAGHHATERYGVQALGEHLVEKYALEYRFFDQTVGV